MPFISLLSLEACIAAYLGLAIWCLLIRPWRGAAFFQIPAFAGIALSAAALLFDDPMALAIAELLRDGAWLVYLYRVLISLGDGFRLRRATATYLSIVAALSCVRVIVALSVVSAPPLSVAFAQLSILSMIAHWAFALAGLLLAHHLFRAVADTSAPAFSLIAVVLGAMWAYELNLYSLALLGYRQALLFAELRGLFLLLLAPAFAVAARRKEHWRLAMSRQAATQSLLLVGLGSYFVVIATASKAIALLGGIAADVYRLLFAIVLLSASLFVAYRPALRARIKIFVIKHFFEHRYDYRTEWLRFSATIAERGSSETTVEERAIRSLTDVTESPGGMLWLCDGRGSLVLASCWQRAPASLSASTHRVSEAWLEAIGHSGWILGLDDIRVGPRVRVEETEVPEWLLADTAAWVVVPLVRSAGLVGMVVLDRPLVKRPLDWEDYDLFKVIAQQVVVHLTDAQRQAELEEAKRFDEFNRRFAFIIHDLKNVVSQLSLVSANAAEHGANPKFQEAMAKTLANATGKMTTMLSKLSPSQVLAGPDMRVVEPKGILDRLAREAGPDTNVAVEADDNCPIMADGDQLREAIGHLVSNAIEASAPGAPVMLAARRRGEAVEISVTDRGQGMSAEFIQGQLFRPFVSTKANGFGLGAAEARSRVTAMGGALDVVSTIGEGTRFILTFPLHADSGGKGTEGQ